MATDLPWATFQSQLAWGLPSRASRFMPSTDAAHPMVRKFYIYVILFDLLPHHWSCESHSARVIQWCLLQVLFEKFKGLFIHSFIHLHKLCKAKSFILLDCKFTETAWVTPTHFNESRGIGCILLLYFFCNSFNSDWAFSRLENGAPAWD